MRTSSSCSAPRRMLQGCTNIGTLPVLCRAHENEYCDIMEEMLCFFNQTAPDDPQLSADPTELELLSVDRYTQLEIPVYDFREADVLQIHRACWTGKNAFRNGSARNNWVWVQTGGKPSYGDLRGQAVTCLLTHFKIRTVLRKATAVHRLGVVRVLDLINGVILHLASGHIQVRKRSIGPDMRIVGIGAVIG